MGQMSIPEGEEKGGLSSEKREDLWALLIAAAVLVAALAAPGAIHDFFKTTLFVL